MAAYTNIARDLRPGPIMRDWIHMIMKIDGFYGSQKQISNVCNHETNSNELILWVLYIQMRQHFVMKYTKSIGR